MQTIHSVSNRQTPVKFEMLGRSLSNEVEMLLNKVAKSIEVSMDKKAMMANGFHLFSSVRKIIASKLGVSEMIADELTSKVITKSEQIMREFGGIQNEIIHNIIEEMSKQSIDNPINITKGVFDLHPVTHQSKEIMETIKLRLISEMGMTNSEAEAFKNIVYRNAQDLTVILRPKKREEIAGALVDLIVDTNDKTAIYNIKSSPTLLEALKAFL